MEAQKTEFFAAIKKMELLYPVKLAKKSKSSTGQMIAELSFTHAAASQEAARMVIVVAIDGSSKIIYKNAEGEKTVKATGNTAVQAVLNHYNGV